jgi:hypothetical protein
VPAAETLPAEPPISQPINRPFCWAPDLLLDGHAAFYNDGYAAGVPMLRAALAAFGDGMPAAPSSPGQSRTRKRHPPWRIDGELLRVFDTDAVVDLANAGRGPGGGDRVIVRGPGTEYAGQDYQAAGERLDREPVPL